MRTFFFARSSRNRRERNEAILQHTETVIAGVLSTAERNRDHAACENLDSAYSGLEDVLSYIEEATA